MLQSTCEWMPHVEGIPQKKGSRLMQRSSRHGLVQHAAHAAGIDGVQHGRLQLWRNLWEYSGPQVVAQLRGQLVSWNIY